MYGRKGSRNFTVRTHALVIISVRHWLDMQDSGLVIVRWVSCRIKVSWVCFMHIYTVVMCMLAIVAPPGCMVNGISAKTAC